MIIVKIANDVSQKVLEEIERFVKEEGTLNPAFNGWEFEVERGEFTEILAGEDQDNLDLVGLFYGIQNIILESKI